MKKTRRVLTRSPQPLPQEGTARPRIEELEQLLDAEEEPTLEILPNGAILAEGGSDAAGSV